MSMMSGKGEIGSRPALELAISNRKFILLRERLYFSDAGILQMVAITGSSTVLSAYGQAVANVLDNSGVTTAYVYPTILQDGTLSVISATPIIDLTSATPYGYADCSSWVHYVMNTLAPVQDAYVQALRNAPLYNQTVTAYGGQTVVLNGSFQPWAQANVLQDAFASASAGTNGLQTIDVNNASVGLTALQAGDLIAYSTGIYTDPDAANASTNPELNATGDTGHVMVVRDMPTTVPISSLPSDQQTALAAAGVVTVYAVNVIDSSDVPHANDSRPENSGNHYVQRVQDGILPAAAFIRAGGIGMGTLYFGATASGQMTHLMFRDDFGWHPTSSAPSALKLSAARLTGNADLDVILANLRSAGVTVADNRLTVTVDPNAATTIAGNTYAMTTSLTGSAGLLVQGGGTLTLNGNSTYSGGTVLNGVTLNVTTATGAGTGGISTRAGSSNTIWLHSGKEAITANGADTIHAGAAEVALNGTGTFLFMGGSGASTVSGGSGASTLLGGSGGGVYSAAASGIVAASGNTTLVGAGHNSLLFGGESGTVMFGSGTDTLVGGSGQGVLVSTGGNAIVTGSGQSSVFGGQSGQDTVVAAQGSNTVIAGAGNMALVGGGNTTLWGGSGNTELWTGAGSMQAALGSGQNAIFFGSGAATIFAGTGQDVFQVTKGQTGGNTQIYGFNAAADTLRLSGYAAGDVSVAVQGGSSVMALAGGATVTFVGVTGLNWQSS
ncbi:Adhesin family protein [Granulibacter bethesdensis CGDNIH1]|uniref:Adhesin family protein n=2 Tax=Granulibacter bethesdensis TaxID=364410 RepID=Q0BUI9_GRABC|nr:Adhesin family protein [Granulibacter bethesdensis CGDNIH1]APH51310.1 Adhesin family protein [Granulibacter bethesdensis]APH64004.1 Adhesin family protein [Granulibacter bethesdensis]